MEEREIRFRQKRELGQVMSDSFDFLKQESKSILRIITVYVLPFIVLYAIAEIYFQRNVLTKFNPADIESMNANFGHIYLNIFIFLGFHVFIQSLLAGTYYSYIEAYIKKGKGNFGLSDIAPHFFANSILALGAGVIITILSIVGGMFCLLPGIYVASTFSLVFFILIFEKKGLNNAMAKSWRLANSQWWGTFALNVLGVIFVFGINIVLSLPALIINTPQAATAGSDAIEYPQWYWIASGASTVISTAFFIVLYTFLAFQYFNLVERLNPPPPKDIV